MARENFTRGLGTYIETESPLLGGLDFLFGEDPDNPNDINRDTSLNRLGVETGVDQQVTNLAGQTAQAGTAVTDSTRVADVTQMGEQTGVQSTGAFTGQTGLGQVGYDPATGQFTAGLNPAFAGNQAAALGASAGAYGALTGMDFDSTMAQRYNALEALQERDRIQAQLDMEDRLYAQGRLGSSGGALQQRALMDAIGLQQRQNVADSFGQAMGLREQLGGQAIQFGAAGLAPEQLSLQQLAAIGALAPQFSSATSLQDSTRTDTGIESRVEDILTTRDESQDIQRENLGFTRVGAEESIRSL